MVGSYDIYSFKEKRQKNFSQQKKSNNSSKKTFYNV